MKVAKGYLYTKDHEWIKVEGEYALIGLSDYAQEHLGDIVYVELPEVGDEFAKGEALGSVESVKTASDINMPAGGIVEEVNVELNDNPALINEDAYAAWVVKVKLTDESDLDDLMDEVKYEKFSQEEA